MDLWEQGNKKVVGEPNLYLNQYYTTFNSNDKYTTCPGSLDPFYTLS